MKWAARLWVVEISSLPGEWCPSTNTFRTKREANDRARELRRDGLRWKYRVVEYIRSGARGA